MKLLPLATSFACLLVQVHADAPQDYRYKVETLLEAIPQPMELEIAPDGRIYFNEYGGFLKIYNPATKQVIEAGRLTVFKDQENGFLGFALDPKFAQNNWIYCLYSPPDFSGQTLSRFTMTGDSLDLTSEKVLLRYEEQRKECCHHAGSVEFGPDGNLYFSTGDNTHPFGDSGSYAPIDERPGRAPWDAQKSASNTNSLSGKVCRIRPKADGTYEIPAGNLFPPGTEKARPEIYTMGCRNPWRMSVDQKTGYVYWGDVGPDANGDGPRGSRGYDEINQARKAGNFGWPYFVGNNAPYADYDFATKTLGMMFDPLHPINEGPNNTGLRDLPPATPAFIYWPYGASKQWPELGSGGRTACAGPVFYWKPEFENTNGFPKEFDRSLLFWDWNRPFVKWAKLDEQSNLSGILPFGASSAAKMKRPTDAVFGPDGCLYIIDFGTTWGANKDSRLLKISYLHGNLVPVAKASATPTNGKEPLTVELSAKGSMDLENDPLKFIWKLQPGGKVIGNTESLKIEIKEPGNYVVELEVNDGKGGVVNERLPITVGNSLPQVAFAEPRDGEFYTPGKPLKYKVTVNDAEDGSSARKPDELGVRTMVTAELVSGAGKDAVDPGLALMKQSDCFNCHAVEQRVVGPALMEIADKYRNQAGAIDLANKRVREGSSNVWGPAPMLAHPQHTTDEIAIMLRWVFGLEKGKSAALLARGVVGEFSAPTADKSGLFVLEANYTDAGRGTVAPLSGSARVMLRSRRVEAESGSIQGSKALPGSNASGSKFVGSINHGNFVSFTGLNLSDSRGVTVRATSGGTGGKVEIRAGSPTGELLSEIDVPVTGGWDKWQEYTAQLSKPVGRGDVCVVFTNPGKAALMNLDWIQFNP